MGKRILWFWSLSLCIGCTVLNPPPDDPAKPQAAPDADPLKCAAECLERGDDAAALPHLTRYVEAHPDHAVIRVHLAEVLTRTGQRAEARRQYERYIADAQELGADAGKHMIHVHTKLVDIARADRDEYGERLHRGIGLFLLAGQVTDETSPEPEKLLFKAAAELKAAVAAKPDEAQAYWYAYEVWTRLGQSLPARTSLRKARDCAALSELTSVERESLAVACDGEFAAR